MDPNQAEELRRSADQFTEAVRELSRSVDRLAEYESAWVQFSRLWEVFEERVREQGETVRVVPFVPFRVGLPEKDAAALAVATVREVRQELWGDRDPDRPLQPPPSPENIDEWEYQREERRKRDRYRSS